MTGRHGIWPEQNVGFVPEDSFLQQMKEENQGNNPVIWDPII